MTVRLQLWLSTMTGNSLWCASTGMHWTVIRWKFRRGKLDYPGEPMIDCAYRELEEETGFKTEKLEYLLSLNTTIAFCDEAIDVFLARNLIPSEQHLDPDEEIEVEDGS